jgi:hypothetical protein
VLWCLLFMIAIYFNKLQSQSELPRWSLRRPLYRDRPVRNPPQLQNSSEKCTTKILHHHSHDNICVQYVRTCDYIVSSMCVRAMYVSLYHGARPNGNVATRQHLMQADKRIAKREPTHLSHSTDGQRQRLRTFPIPTEPAWFTLVDSRQERVCVLGSNP